MGWKTGILAMLFGLSQASQASADPKNIVVLDVRTPEEHQTSHVKESINIDFFRPDFKAEIEKLDKTKDYKVYCRSGNRSGKAEVIMKSMGFKSVENIGGLSEAAKRLGRECEGKSC